MAEKAKAAREVDKEELLISIEEANDALDSASKNLLRSNVLRTLQTRKKSLSASFDQWNRSCREYSSKVFSSATSEEKQQDTADNIKPVRKSYMETMDALNDIIEEKTSQDSSAVSKQNREAEIKMQIETLCKEIDTKILHHGGRVCPAELGKAARERMYKELDKDINDPVDAVKKLYGELILVIENNEERVKITADQEKWMDSTTKSILEISDKYNAIPEPVVHADTLDSSATLPLDASIVHNRVLTHVSRRILRS